MYVTRNIIKNHAQRQRRWLIVEKEVRQSEVKPVENISKNLQSFLEISPVQKEVLLSHILRDHAYEYWNLFRLKEDNLSQRNCQNQLSHPGLPHTEQECQESLIQGKIHTQQNENRALRFW